MRVNKVNNPHKDWGFFDDRKVNTEVNTWLTVNTPAGAEKFEGFHIHRLY